MTDTPPTSEHQDRALIVLLDQALAMAVDRLTPEQCAHLQERAQAMGLGDHIELRCSPEVQGVLLGERPRVNPDGGRVGDAASKPPAGAGGSTIEEGSARTSGTPTL